MSVLCDMSISVFIGTVVSNANGIITYWPTYVKFGAILVEVVCKGCENVCDFSHWTSGVTATDEASTACVDSTDRSDWPS